MCYPKCKTVKITQKSNFDLAAVYLLYFITGRESKKKTKKKNRNCSCLTHAIFIRHGLEICIKL